MSFHAVFRAAAAGAAVFALGCGEGQSPAGTTRLSVLLTDAPGDVTAAVVTIEEVQLIGEDGVLTVSEGPATVDLLSLAGATADLVDDAVVPSGTYRELRFVLGGAYIAVETEAGPPAIYASSPSYAGLPAGATVTGQLQMPSLAQSGLKVTLAVEALTLTAGQKILLVDFDARQSFGRPAGQSGRWVMHPVITGGEIEATERTAAASP
jgi:hypothetical protein